MYRVLPDPTAVAAPVVVVWVSTAISELSVIVAHLSVSCCQAKEAMTAVTVMQLSRLGMRWPQSRCDVHSGPSARPLASWRLALATT